MASATKYSWTRVDGSTGRAWRAVWTGPDGRKRFKRGFDRKTDAEDYANDRESEIRHGVTLEGDKPSSRTTLESWSATWLSGQEVRATTASSYKYVVKRINTELGGRSLGGLRPSEIRAWRRGLEQRFSTATADQTASVLAMMLRAAVEDGLIPKSPMPARKGGRTFRVVDPSQLLTKAQVAAWDAKLTPHARGMATVAAYTGLRQGELLGLCVDQVDFLGRRIHIRHQLQSGRFVPPKTAAGVRTVPLPEVASQALAAHIAEYPSPAGEPIFLTRSKHRWTRTGFNSAWSTARTDAEIPDTYVWHDLRDVAASALIRAGVDVRSVMAILGHASSEETLRTYARLWPDAHDVAVKALNDLLSEDSGSHGVATKD